MTIIMRASWNGLEQGTIQNLGATEEARLIAAGIAADHTATAAQQIRGDAVVNQAGQIVVRDDTAGGLGQVVGGGVLTARDLQDVAEIAAYLDTTVQGGMIELPTAMEFNTTTPMSLNLAKVGLNMNGSRINSDMNQPLFTLTYSHPNPAGVNRTLSRSRFFGGGTLVGPGKNVAGSEAIQMNGTVAPMGVRPTLKDLVIHSYGIGVDMVNRTYLSMAYSVDIYQSRIGIRQQAADDAGENCSWFGGVIANCDLAMHMLDNSSEHFFFGYSIDYVRQLIVAQGAPTRVNLMACHVEPRGSNLVSDDGNYVLDGTGTDPRAAIPGRDTFIDIDGNGSQFLMVGGWLDPNNSGGEGPYAWQQFVNVRHKNSAAIFRDVSMLNIRNVNELFATGPGIVETSGRHMAAVAARHMPARTHNDARGNRLVDGGIEDGSFPDLWCIFRDGANLITTAGQITNRLTGTNGSISRSTAQAFAGSSSLRFTKLTTGANTQFRAGVIIPTAMGVRNSFFCRVFKPASGGIGGGNIFVSMRYAKMRGVGADGVPSLSRIGSEASAFTINTSTLATGQWSIVAMEPFANGAAGEIAAPSWADCVTIQFYADDAALTTGDLFFDDFVVS